MNEEYDVIIIGAGVAGLSAALKLAAEKKKVLVVESQPVPGGLATSFRRNNFYFESSLHCVNSLGPEGEVKKLFDEFGVSKKLTFIPLQQFCRIVYPRHDFVADFNKQHLISFLKKTFPGEAKALDRLFAYYDSFYRQFDAFSESSLPEWLTWLLLPFRFPLVIKMSCVTIKQVINAFTRNSELEALLTDIWRFIGLPPSRLSALYFLIVFRGYLYEQTSFLKGGYASIVKAVVDRLKEQGCSVRLNTTVTKIITGKSLRVQGVVVNQGETITARSVISNANCFSTLTQLIDNGAVRQKYTKKLAAQEKSISAVQVYLGLRCPAQQLGMKIAYLSVNGTYDQDSNMRYMLQGDYQRAALFLVDHAQLDPGLAPAHKGTLLIMTFDTYARWSNLNGDEYNKKKLEVADMLIARAEAWLPGLRNAIEVKEVATPLTFERYAQEPEGAIYGLAHSVLQSSVNRLSQKTCVKGLFLAGAWTFPGAGFHACFLSGQNAAEYALSVR
ncbi:MAG: NAD(P)/FAD-dependent oxidoreductase [Candidatus Omnitrophica bacterium]|nr:NAD(P)/FAD-dependent oxidoreductase [Candidatus Omnitrophota bacterium]